jgi:hypothetical protein
MESFYVIEVQEDFNAIRNDKKYVKGHRHIVWKDFNCYRIANNDMDFIPHSIAKEIYKIEFTKVD